MTTTNNTFVLVIDDHHPDPTQRPFVLFGPFDGWDAAEEWALAHDALYNDWQAVTAEALPGAVYTRATIVDTDTAEHAWPLYPVPPMDPELRERIWRAERQQQAEQPD